MNAWLIRAGETGSRDSWCLEKGYAGGGWTSIGDLTPYHSMNEMFLFLQQCLPNEKAQAISHFRGQLWKLRHTIAMGDLVVLPLKSTKQIAIGIVNGPYKYLGDELDPGKRHVISVDWKRTNIARSAVGQDLLYSLGAYMTICEIKRNDAAKRLEQLMLTGVDPGDQHAFQGINAAPESEVDQEGPLLSLDLEQISSDAIISLINQKFLSHEMTRLVAAVLTAKGFHCEVKPPGPDGGVDILAGMGPLGLDSPKIVVQVKSQSATVGDEVVQTLQGAITRFGADQALLVAWGGVGNIAKKFLETEKFSIRVWDAEALMQEIFQHYSKFPEELRAELPLKQVWMLIPNQG